MFKLVTIYVKGCNYEFAAPKSCVKLTLYCITEMLSEMEFGIISPVLI